MASSAAASGTASRRAVAAYHRVVGAPEWPIIAAALLGMLVAVEIVLRSTYAGGAGGPIGGALAIELVLGWATTAPLAFARGHVFAAPGAVLLAGGLAVAAGRPTAVGMIAQVVALYVLAGRHSWRVAALVLPWLAVHLSVVVGDGHRESIAVLVAAGCSLGLGRLVSVRRAEAEHEAARRAVADTMLRLAASDERARIARELHDVVAHHISMIAVQAETARVATSGMPEEGARRLLAIGDTARTALTEMRRLLGVLREGTGSEPVRSPQPGLHQLNELIDLVRDSTRTSARLIVRGRVAALDPGIELTTYRLVQEALTNARRHAPGAAVDVELDYTDTALRVRIRDNGPGTDRPVQQRRGAPGHGLLGMRERAAMVGGTVTAGPAAGAGFEVRAVLPRAEP